MKILDIITENNNVPYTTLADAGEFYQPGSTQIWYLKKGNNAELLDPNNPSATHAMVGTITEKDPEMILSMMQIESWDPDNRAEKMLAQLGVQHTSMNTGDAVVVESTMHVILSDGFKELEIQR